jgi:DNA-binding helix-hairpin-helix protein with protein kinase domain
VKRAALATIAAAVLFVLSVVLAGPLLVQADGPKSGLSLAVQWAFADWRLGALGVSIVGFLSSVAFLLIVRTASPYGAERRSRAASLKSSEGRTRELRRRRDGLTAEYSVKYKEVRGRLEALRGQYLTLQPGFDQEIARLEREKEQTQRRAYLDDQYIERAKIPKIGDGRKALLRGYGIETALDVFEHSHTRIPGFGPGLRSALNGWARQVQQGFRFDPRKGIPESDRRSLVAEFRRRQVQYEAQLRKGAADLRELTAAAERRGGELEVKIGAAEKEAAQARADWLVLGEPSAR